MEGGSLQAEASSSAIRSGDCALGLPEHVQDVLALSILQTVILAASRNAIKQDVRIVF
jgi:hypothetical protein